MTLRDAAALAIAATLSMIGCSPTSRCHPAPRGTTYLGITLESPSGERYAIVKQIDPNSPAERAYLQVGDIITDLNGSPADSRTVGRYIESHHPNDKMKLAVVRPHFFAKDDHFTTEVTLGTSPCSPDP